MMAHKGQISEWYPDKGYGFITPVHGGNKVRFTEQALKRRKMRPKRAMPVRFSISKDVLGHAQAANIEPLSGISFDVFFAIIFITALGGATFYYRYPIEVVYWLLAVNLLMSLVVALDVCAWRNTKPQTSGAALLFIAVFGGWILPVLSAPFSPLPTRSLLFRAGQWVVMFAHFAVLIYSLSGEGREQMQLIVDSGRWFLSHYLPGFGQ
ncbi:hypothetical protein M1D72_04640 [Vibrio sp. AK197]